MLFRDGRASKGRHSIIIDPSSYSYRPLVGMVCWSFLNAIKRREARQKRRPLLLGWLIPFLLERNRLITSWTRVKNRRRRLSILSLSRDPSELNIKVNQFIRAELGSLHLLRWGSKEKKSTSISFLAQFNRESHFEWPWKLVRILVPSCRICRIAASIAYTYQ